MEILSKGNSTIYENCFFYPFSRLDCILFGKIAMESVTQREAPKLKVGLDCVGISFDDYFGMYRIG